MCQGQFGKFLSKTWERWHFSGFVTIFLSIRSKIRGGRAIKSQSYNLLSLKLWL